MRYGVGCEVVKLPVFLLIILMVQLSDIAIADGDVVFDEGLCVSKIPVDVGMRGEVLGSFYFDKSCVFNAGSKDELRSEISLRLNYKKLPNGSMYIYNDPAPSDLYVYVNIRPTLNVGFIDDEIERIMIRKNLGKSVLGEMYESSRYSHYSFNAIDVNNKSYYFWCVSGGACGRVASLTETLIFEVVIPESEAAVVSDIASQVLSFLRSSLK